MANTECFCRNLFSWASQIHLQNCEESGKCILQKDYFVCLDGQVRLVYNPYNYEYYGRVEVQHNYTWGTVCLLCLINTLIVVFWIWWRGIFRVDVKDEMYVEFNSWHSTQIIFLKVNFLIILLISLKELGCPPKFKSAFVNICFWRQNKTKTVLFNVQYRIVTL
jgi:hypothetical protein